MLSVDKTALSTALNGDGVVIHYFLVGRYNSPEMGHKDVIQFIVLDVKGRVVAKTKNKYSLDYPLGFCEEKQWRYNFLL